MSQSLQLRLALHQDVLVLLRELRRNHPFVAATAARLAEIVEEGITAFKAALELQRLESIPQGRASTLGVNLADMRALVEALFEQRRRISSERDVLKKRVKEYLIAIGAPDENINSISMDQKRLDSGSSVLAGDVASAPSERTSPPAAEVAKERAQYVAKIQKELMVLKNRGVVAGELQPLRRQYPLFECLQLADDHPHLARKLEALSERKRVISLALDFAAFKFGRARSTISTDWKRHKPKEFRQQKPQPAKRTKARTQRRG